MGLYASAWGDAYPVHPIADFRGDFVDGADADGKRLPCGNGPCLIVWPRFSAFYTQRATQTNFFGSLVTGKEDASGFTYMRNRYYNPHTGAFTQSDPIGLAGGLNTYGFAAGDPVTYSDPYGLSAEDCCRADLESSRQQQERTLVWAGENPRDARTLLATGLGAAAAGLGLLEAGGAFLLRAASSRAITGGAAGGAAAGAAGIRQQGALVAPGGRKLAQMIGRWGGGGGRDGFMAHAHSIANQAQAAGQVVNGQVGSLANASVYRLGSSYMVVDADRVIRSYVHVAGPGGIVDVYRNLGGR
jgi:RHS repeat-associated protein